ncbi:MAG: imelysin family protein [Pseudomonadota bacterium]
MPRVGNGASRYINTGNFQFWPDKHGTAARQIRKVMNEKDMAILDANRFEQGSAALQGLPAFERVLYRLGRESGADTADNRFTCAYLTAISMNLASMAADLADEWRGVYRESIGSAGDASDFFDSPLDPIGEWLSQFATQLEIVRVLKLKAPLGLKDSSSRIRLKKAESWRSDRSMQNIRINLAALNEFYTLVIRPLLHNSDTIRRMDRQLETLIVDLNDLSEELPNLAKNQLDALRILVDDLEALGSLVESRVTADLGVSIGFNSLDGD